MGWCRASMDVLGRRAVRKDRMTVSITKSKNIFRGDPRPHVTLPADVLMPMLPSQNNRLTRFFYRCMRDIGMTHAGEALHDAISAWAYGQLISPRLVLFDAPWVLDLGCGDGRDLRRIEADLSTTVGLVGLTVEKKERAGRINFLHSDIHYNDLNDMSFHCVIASHVLEHSPIPYFVLTEMNRVLAKEGFAYVELPQPHQSWCEGNANHYSVMGSEMWEELFRRSCFRIDSKWDIETDDGTHKFWAYELTKERNWA